MTKPHSKLTEAAEVFRPRVRRNVSLQLEVDYERYQQLLACDDLTSRQKADFIDALWAVISAFIDLGFNVHPIQQAIPETLFGEGLNRGIIESVDEFFRQAA
ncbi:hypothetical protein [Cereibacter changlensis]|uniref:hypothetical protein n=1 Tax=Cereibacter changlensis TaxID=402884 RepID=UPI004034E411